MRRDILIHINTGDVVLGNTVPYAPQTFRWVDNPGGLARYIYCEADIPSGMADSEVWRKGVVVRIPYTPVYKEFKVRIRRVYADNVFQYLQNPVDGTVWFTARAEVYGGKRRNIYASELVTVSEDAFRIVFDGGQAVIYNADTTDFQVGRADVQNANCLLACVPGNNYRFPVTGVGLRRYINSTNINNTGLSSLLKSEFAADGVQITQAVYNYSTHQLDLNLNPPE